MDNSGVLPKVRSALTLPSESRHGDFADQAFFHREMYVNAGVVDIIIADAEQAARFQARKGMGLEDLCANVTCKAEISPARREALPHATHCRKCADEIQKRKSNRK